MKSSEIRTKYLEFFKNRGHAVIPSASLVPENDPSSLFTTAGMQPLVPYLLGEKHPQGTRLVDVQKCVRTGDIDDVGDNRHLTFFEMLGNWSLGDYFKEDAIKWSFEFLTSKTEGLGLDKNRLYVTVFKGENGIPRDEEAIAVWKKVFQENGISAGVAGEDEMLADNVRIIPLGVNDNFWIAGASGPCGGDTEMFYDTKPELGKPQGKFSDLVDSFRFIEVWNDVFMEFNKTPDGKYEKLAKKNVDTGMGLERTTAVVNGKDTVFDTDLFQPLLAELDKLSPSGNIRSKRIIADHIRTAVFMLADGVLPSNTDRGYVLRRLIRRAVRYGKELGLKKITTRMAPLVLPLYEHIYADLTKHKSHILSELEKEELKFEETLEEGLRAVRKIFDKKTPLPSEKFNALMQSSDKNTVLRNFFRDTSSDIGKFGLTKEDLEKATVTGDEAFMIYQSFGFPIEMIVELAREKKLLVDIELFKERFKKHQELSRVGSEKKFKGGLGDTSDVSVKYHTATHLLNAALRKVLGAHVMQKGSNITPERLRFDFSHPQKMTDEEKRKVEDQVNEWIKESLPVICEELPKAEAEKVAIHAFGDKYGDVVKVYSVGAEGDYISREFCGGPHVDNTSVLGHFKIQKEEAVSQGVRRIKAVLE